MKGREIKGDKTVFEDLERYDLPKGWTYVRIEKLANVCTKITDGSHNSPSNSSTNEIPYVTAKNIRPRKLDFTEITYVTKEDHKEIFSRCNPEKGDVLYTKDGTVGYAVVNECDFEFSLLSSVALLKPDHTILDSYYLENFLNNPITYDSVIKKMSGTALRRIILKRIKEIQIPIPSLNEQKRIVSKIESIFAQIDAERKSLDNAKVLLKQCRQSVLNDAFNGNLFSHTTENWNSQTLDDISKSIRDGTHTPPIRTKKGYPMLSAKHIQNGFIDWDTSYSMISKYDFNEITK